MKCFLCQRELTQLTPTRWQHAVVEDCLVRLTDELGISVDDLDEPEPEPDTQMEVDDLQVFPYVDVALQQIFESVGRPRLGGVSSGSGWSSYRAFQLCPYYWKRRYLDPLPPSFIPPAEPPARAIGSVIHAFLAVYYTRMIEPGYPLTPEDLKQKLLLKTNPDYVHEGWRVFASYAIYYQHEEIWPLAVEYDLKDPRTKESCRFDLIAHFPQAHGDRPAGTFNVEHKSSQRFDDQTLNGWANDGEVLGQMMLWKRLGLDKRFGELKGTIVNILGRQKDPQFHRTYVAAETWQDHQHASDLKKWEAQIHLAVVSGSFARSRANCINRYGKCDLFDHCATVDG